MEETFESAVRDRHGEVDIPLALYKRFTCSTPGSSCLLDATLNHGPVSILR